MTNQRAVVRVDLGMLAKLLQGRHAALRGQQVRQPESKVPRWTAEDEVNLARRVRRMADQGLAKSLRGAQDDS